MRHRKRVVISVFRVEHINIAYTDLDDDDYDEEVEEDDRIPLQNPFEWLWPKMPTCHMTVSIVLHSSTLIAGS